MAHYYCLLIDVDGTLLDFDAAERAAIHNTLAHFDLPNDEATAQLYQEINAAHWAALERGELKQAKLVVSRFEKLLKQLGKTGDPVRMNDYYLTQLSLGADPMPGALDALRELAEVATIAIVSNGIERVQMNRLERSGIAQYCDDVFISSRVGASKPERKIFDTALRTLGVESRSRVLVVGDSLKADIGGGAKAGLATCWCNFKEQTPEPGAPTPTYTIHDFDALLRIVMEEEELLNVGSKEKRHQL